MVLPRPVYEFVQVPAPVTSLAVVDPPTAATTVLSPDVGVTFAVVYVVPKVLANCLAAMSNGVVVSMPVNASRWYVDFDADPIVYCTDVSDPVVFLYQT
jgi:hypothetical protein